MSYARLVSVEERQTKNGSSYIMGTLALPNNAEEENTQWPFKMWGTTKDDFGFSEGDIVSFEAKKDSYNGVESLIMSSCTSGEDSGLSISDFLPADPNKERNWKLYCDLLQKHLSPSAYGLFEKLVAKNDFIKSRFTEEFAGRHMHDAYPGGLQWHSFKVTYHVVQAITLSTNIKNHVNTDVLILGAALHDLMKITEYDHGIYSDKFFVGHRALLVEFYTQHKDDIVPVFGEEGYYRLITIANQHHGEYEERPRTIEAALVHFADMFDTTVTMIDEAIPDFQKTGTPIRVNSFRVQ